MSLPARALALLLAAAALLAGGYRWGATASDNRHAAEQLKTQRQAEANYRAEVARGDAAVTALQADRAALTTGYMNLQEAFNAHLKANPLVVRRSAHVPLAAMSPGEFGATATAPAEPSPSAQVPSPDTGCSNSVPVEGPELVLSNGAVWMWNSALSGTDRPAGACGAADPTAPACAAESGATLEDAWRNHEANAQLCAEDRLNHQRLIDFITARQKKSDSP